MNFMCPKHRQQFAQGAALHGISRSHCQPWFPLAAKNEVRHDFCTLRLRYTLKNESSCASVPGPGQPLKLALAASSAISARAFRYASCLSRCSGVCSTIGRLMTIRTGIRRSCKAGVYSRRDVAGLPGGAGYPFTTTIYSSTGTSSRVLNRTSLFGAFTVS